MQGLVQNYSGLLTTRFFLGVFESGMFPGCFYLIGMWYRRHEAQKRYTFFFSSTTLAGAFGGLLAAAIGKMSGLRGYVSTLVLPSRRASCLRDSLINRLFLQAGWRWICKSSLYLDLDKFTLSTPSLLTQTTPLLVILEGALTVAVSFIFFFCIPSFPEEAAWLSPDEKAYVAARLRMDQGRSAAERKITLRDVQRVFKDYKVIVAGFMYFGLIVPAYSYAYFAPGIIQSYGYDPIQTQLHSVPPWAAAFAWAMLLATISDATKHRFGFAVLSICVGITGFGILITVHDNQPLQYGEDMFFFLFFSQKRPLLSSQTNNRNHNTHHHLFPAALFLVTMGTYGAMPIIVCWFNMNLGGHHRRSVGSAWQVSFGNIGGIIAVFAFLPEDAPKYVTG